MAAWMPSRRRRSRNTFLSKIVMTKVCTRCNQEKPESEFYRNYKTVDKKASQCKKCTYEVHKIWQKAHSEQLAEQALARYHANPEEQRRKSRKYLYGVSQEQYESLLQQQSGVCAICKLECKCHPRLSVDHCHASDKIRGLLCHACNLGLGNFKDSPVLLLEALKYLQQ